MIQLPEHKCGLYLEHNSYRDYYTPLTTAVEEEGEHWISEDERAKALESGEIWTLQWYPNTPIGFYRVVGSSLESVIEASHRAR